MRRTLSAIAAALCVLGVTASGQDSRPIDARAALQTALEAMGGTNLKTLQYSGAGWSSRIGQTYTLNEDWPKYQVADYTRAIDDDAKWSREDYTRQQGNYPTLGRPPMARVTMRTLHQNMLKLKLDVAQHVPTHGRVGANDEFIERVMRGPQRTGTGSAQQ